ALLALAPAILQVRGKGAVAAAVDADGARGIGGACACLDIDKPRGSKPILCGHCAGDDVHTPNQAGFKHVTETGYAIRELNSIDTVLQIGVLVADVKISASGAVLIDA